jgi:hypothetical protein
MDESHKFPTIEIFSFFYVITNEFQPYWSEGAESTCFTGVCGQDGHSQAPMDGFMASREAGGPSPGNG